MVVQKSEKALRNHFNNINRKFDPFLKEEYYNCWALTAFLMKWEKQVYWMTEGQMNFHLKKHTEEITFPKIGDIVEFRTSKGNAYSGRNGLMHTAIITEIREKNNKQEIICVHKPGGGDIEVRDLKGITKIYSDYVDVVKFVRKVA